MVTADQYHLKDSVTAGVISCYCTHTSQLNECVQFGQLHVNCSQQSKVSILQERIELTSYMQWFIVPNLVRAELAFFGERAINRATVRQLHREHIAHSRWHSTTARSHQVTLNQDRGSCRMIAQLSNSPFTGCPICAAARWKQQKIYKWISTPICVFSSQSSIGL